MSVCNLDIIAEHIIVSNLEAGNARGFYLTLLHLHQVILPLIGYLTQFVELGIDAGTHHYPAVESRGSVIDNLPGDTVTDTFTGVELFADRAQCRSGRLHAHGFYGSNSTQCVAQLHQLTRRHSAYRYL